MGARWITGFFGASALLVGVSGLALEKTWANRIFALFYVGLGAWVIWHTAVAPSDVLAGLVRKNPRLTIGTLLATPGLAALVTSYATGDSWSTPTMGLFLLCFVAGMTVLFHDLP